MRKPIPVVMTAILVLALATVAMAADPFVGTWKLNVANSKTKGLVNFKSAVATFAALDNGIKVVEDSVDADGNAYHLEFDARFDGKDYPLTGVPNFDTIALNKINSSTWGEVLKKAGKEIFRARSVVSKDGKTLTRTEKGKNDKGQDINNTLVYDKQ